MKSSGTIYSDVQDEKDAAKTFGQEYSNVQSLRMDSTSTSPNSPISGPAESEIENKQLNYDIKQRNIRNYIAQTFEKGTNRFNANKSVISTKTRPDDSNIKKSFMIDHEKARLREKKYKDELEIIKNASKKITKKKKKVVVKNDRRSPSNKKTSSVITKNKKRELKTQVKKANNNKSEKKESVLSNIFSLNIFKNVILRYVVAIISGVIIFAIIFSGLGLISQ